MTALNIHFPLQSTFSRGTILPVFIPFKGCPYHCVYCAQDKQSGTKEVSIQETLALAYQNIKMYIDKHKPESIEIAFYGGTFTALEEKDFMDCLKFFKDIRQEFKQKDIEVYGRCSTRPDCLEGEANKMSRLDVMLLYGLDLIELGIQSFNTNALRLAGRNYTEEIAKKACEKLISKGFLLGIQLMPGMPGQEEEKGGVEIFLDDVKKALSYSPCCLRYYPCLVLKDTGLENLWLEKKYKPWTMDYTLSALGTALAMAWTAKVAVLRLAVATEKDFEEDVLAGVRHPSLGNIIQTEALLKTVDVLLKKYTQEKEQMTLHLPKKCQGFLLGHKNNKKEDWEKIFSLEKIQYIEVQGKKVQSMEALAGEMQTFGKFQKTEYGRLEILDYFSI